MKKDRDNEDAAPSGAATPTLKHVAIAGAGGMALLRGKAFLASKTAVICGVASKRN